MFAETTVVMGPVCPAAQAGAATPQSAATCLLSVPQHPPRTENDGTPARISLLTAEGDVLGSYGNARIREEHDAEAGLLLAPHGIDVDSHGDLYVAEVSSSYQGRVQPFTVQKFALQT